jgi:hypothetical protein
MRKIVGYKDFIKVGCVSFDTAQALVNIYDKICNHCWHIYEQIKPEYNEVYGEYYPHEIKDEFPHEYDEVVESVWGLHTFTATNNEYPSVYAAPMLYDVIQYFIKNYRVFISAYWDNRYNKWGWYYELMDYQDISGVFQDDEYFDDMNEAVDKCILTVAKRLTDNTLFY